MCDLDWDDPTELKQALFALTDDELAFAYSFERDSLENGLTDWIIRDANFVNLDDCMDLMVVPYYENCRDTPLDQNVALLRYIKQEMKRREDAPRPTLNDAFED
jgi:hypothetical protein